MAKKSVITDNMEECFLCGYRVEEVHHAIYGTKDHKQADKFKLLVPLCSRCHRRVHNFPNQKDDLYLKELAQRTFQSVYPELKWTDYFSKNYL